MIEGGVDVAIVFGLAATRAGVHTPNTFVAEFCAQLTTPTIAFTALDPLDADWREQLEEAMSLGFKGVKLYPVLSLFDPLSPEFDPFYQLCVRSEGHTSELQSLMRISYAVFCLKKKKIKNI